MPTVPALATLRQQAEGLIARAPQRGVLAAIQAAATAAAVNGTPLTAGMSAQDLITISQPLIDQADSDVQAIYVDQLIRLIYEYSNGSGNFSSNASLIEMTQSGAYQMINRTLDSDNVITSADVVWPDGATGMYDLVEKNNTFLVADSFQVTYISDTVERVVFQPLVTRNASGYITLKPALTVNDI